MTPQYKNHMVCPQEKTPLISRELRQPSLVHLGHSIILFFVERKLFIFHISNNFTVYLK
jgi:hypothetical protein